MLSGNRNFEARVHQNIRANFLMSPPLVVAFALAGRVDLDLSKDAIGKDREGHDVFLRDLWPSRDEIREAMLTALTPETFRRLYADFAEQNPKWNEIGSTTGTAFDFKPESTYIQEPPFFTDFGMEPGHIAEIHGARPLGIFGDSVTTDHISPAGAIKASSPAGKFLQENGVEPKDFNSYGSRRGNDRVMTRGTFANVLHQEPDGPRRRGWRDQTLPRRRADADLRRRHDVSGRRRPAGDLRRPGIRHRLLPRLGGEGHARCWV